MDGVIVPLEALPDPVFRDRLLGDGVGIDPTGSVVVAPCAGTVTTLHDSKHAVAILTDDGVGVLVHVGLDTVALRGEGFRAKVAVGERVEPGQPLLEIELDDVACKAKSLLTMLLVTEGASDVSVARLRGIVAAGQDELVSGTAGTAGPGLAFTGALETTPPFEVVNDNGIHARPAAELARRAKRYEAEVFLHKDDKRASAASVSDLLSLGLVKGDRVWLSARGKDAGHALAAIRGHVEAGLGEDLARSEPSPSVERYAPEDDFVIGGIPAAPGFAVGIVRLKTHAVPSFPMLATDTAAEEQKLARALQGAKAALRAAEADFRSAEEIEKAEIYAAHAELLDDPGLESEASLAIDGGATAAAAWQGTVVGRAEKLGGLENPLARERADDLLDAGRRVLFAILGLTLEDESYSKDTVLVCDELRPSEVAVLQSTGIGALVTSAGGPTSHAAIILRSMGVPYVAGVGAAISRLRAGMHVIVDGDEGSVRAAGEDALGTALPAPERRTDPEIRAAQEPARSSDGRGLEVGVNAGNVEDVERGVALGADGVGLLRSELLFAGRRSAPTEEEQARVYEAAGRALGPERSLVVRVLDVGGDKPLSYLPMEREANPFLGMRGIRFLLGRPDVFRTQIRALLAASKHTRVRILLPMVSQLEELRQARKLLEDELGRRPAGSGKQVELGIMVEVPSVALLAETFAREADFFSIGTNDLTQYTLAMDRGHSRLASQADALDPSVLRLIEATIRGAKKHGRWVGVCGDLAADGAATALLFGLGVDELSVPGPSVPKVKATLRMLSYEQSRQLAERALALPDARSVRALVSTLARAT